MSERDQQVAQLCLDRGYATSAQIHECLAESAHQGAIRRPIESVLRHRGYISEDTYRLLIRMNADALPGKGTRALKKCAPCGSLYPGDLCLKCLVGFAQQEGDAET